MTKFKTGFLLERIPYIRMGDQTNPVIVINGGQGFVRKHSFDRMLRDAKRVARMLPPTQGFILIGYDQQPEAKATIETIVTDYERAIRDMKVSAFSLIGISYGGLLATKLAAAREGWVKKLILVASAHKFSESGENRINRQIQFAQHEQYYELINDFAAIFRNPLLNLLLKIKLWVDCNKLTEKMNSGDVIVRYLQLIMQAEPVDLTSITARTLIIGGELDQFFGDGMMEAARNSIPDAKLHVLEGQTHMAPVECSRQLRRFLTEFLD
ncbi:TPA: alpha/beta hydrolase [Klebsiella pneumoniae]|uniref:alpha/beta fold hydrolase n=1 Tax=Klebsiella pneumoniae TaxID=573 RepID=UPI0022915C1A|nr:alpha/beta hydrolase [Klebsiella pneumoniae]MDP1205583.1 alpha/beta hydrolase [Klebsiella pneumoniae]HCT6467158.1 alpha/beta hydrolase [Klebsiella pneumoniae]HDZ0993882.1 alpha/beta hydrolase [Klebsiella pneumoniae]